MEENKKICLDCGKPVGKLNHQGICKQCYKRKLNMMSRGMDYIRYLDLPEEEQFRIDRYRLAHQNAHHLKKESNNDLSEIKLTIPDNENYYTSKAEKTPVGTKSMTSPKDCIEIESLIVKNKIIEETILQNILDVLKEIQQIIRKDI